MFLLGVASVEHSRLALAVQFCVFFVIYAPMEERYLQHSMASNTATMSPAATYTWDYLDKALDN